MNIIITNFEEAGMPQEMAENCCKLIAWQIEKTYDSLPGEGDDVTILYSDIDPLQETDEVDDNAYFIYFGVVRVETVPDDTNPDNATVYLELAF
jgi:hypothetical protein